MRKGTKSLLILLSFIFLFPTLAHANAGTALMWLSMFHLAIGNALIGVFEGMVIAKIFRVRMVRSIWISILANYFSMAVGAFLVFLFNVKVPEFATIYNLGYILISLVAASYLLTIALEWPFCYWIFKGQEDRKNRSIKASIIAQTASYAVLIPLYLSCSGITLATKTTVDKSLSFLQTKNAWVYYLSEKGDALYRIRANGAEKQRIQDTGVVNDYSQLFVCNDSGKSVLKMSWYEREKNRFNDKFKVLIDNVPGATAVQEDCNAKNRWYSHEVVDFRPENGRGWKVYTGTWAIEGLRAEDKAHKKSLWIALETPFLMWSITKASVLPGDQVICQVGGQIAVVDLNKSRIGLITFGSSPVVVLEK